MIQGIIDTESFASVKTTIEQIGGFRIRGLSNITMCSCSEQDIYGEYSITQI